MKLTKNQEAEAIKAYEVYFDSYINGDVKTIASMLDDNYNQIGSAEAEVFYNKSEAVQFLKDTINQVAGKTQIRNRFIKLDSLEKYILITDLFDIYVLIEDEWTFYSKFRASTLMEQKKDGWKFIHQHSSLPDTRTGDGDNIAIEKITAENLQLRDAVKRRTVELENKSKELEIEAALERVRAVAMSMWKPEDMLDVCQVISQQLEMLGITNIRNVQTAIIKDNQGVYLNYQYYTAYDEVVFEEIETGKHSKTIEMVEKIKKSEDAIFTGVMQGEELADFREYRKKDGQFADPLMDETDSLHYYFYSIGQGALGLSTYKPISNSQLEIFKRFHNVFKLAYRRFMDIEKAEAQAREAQIEAALERVRSRSMAMHKSEELADLSLELVKQVQALGVATWFCAFNIYDDDQKGSLEWGSNGQGTFPRYRTPREGIFLRYYEAGEQGETLLINEIDENECPTHYDYLCSLPGVGEQLLKMKDEGIPFPASQIDHIAFFKYGYILFITFKPAPEAHDIFKRFAKVFEQTYTRFLDLQKAELQSKEAQIELALERVRARTMAMQSSDELREAVQVIYEQLQHLNFESKACNIIIIDKDTGNSQYWVSGFTQEIYPVSYHVPYFDHPFYEAMLLPWRQGKQYVVYEYDGKNKKSFDKIFFTNTGFKNVPEEAKNAMISLPSVTLSTAFFSYGALQVLGPESISHDKEIILQRLAKVFDQTYTRFLDLQKAEAQAREAQIETALEKVRSRTMAMQKGEELKEVVVLLYKELIALGVTNFVTCGYVEVNEKINRQFTWVTSPGGDSLGLFYLPLSGDVTFDERYAAWKQQQIIFHQKVAGKVRSKHLEYAITTFNSKEAEEMVLGQFPDPCVFYCFNFSHGYLHLVSGSKLKNEEELLLARFTRVFEQTYARFLDLQKAEIQAREAQIEAALEKVRSLSLAMHTANELGEVVTVIVEKLKDLDVVLDANGVVLCTYFNDSKNVMHWIASPDFSFAGSYLLPYFKHPIFDDAWESKESGTEYFSKAFSKDEKDSFFKHAFEHSDYKNFPEDFKQWVFQNDQHILSFAWQKNSAILIPSHTGVLPSEDDVEILKRFAKVFEQAYIRFLDLKKAEAQARESEVELSLERIRAQVTAMQESSDLFDIVVNMRTEFLALGHNADYFWHMRWLPDSYEMSMTSEDGSRIGMVISIPSYVHEKIPGLAKWEKGNEPTYVLALDDDGAWDYIENMNTHGHYEQVDPNAPSQDDIRHIGGLTFIMARTTHGEIGYSLPGVVPNPPKEDLNILVRFAGVFDLAYRRFEDLKSAEHQHKEAQMELALERVRARALAMQQPEELKDVADVLRNEMGKLGIEELETCSIYINDESAEKAECWYAIKDVRESEKILVNDYFALNLNDTWVGREMLKFYQSKNQQVSIVMTGQPRIEWIRYCEERSVPLRGYYGEVIPDRIYHLYKFSHGAIGVATPDNISDENWGLLKRAASVFSLAYSRFKDLTQARIDLRRLKEEKKRAEDALTDLKATQEQLVHAEKMASLGELTAGIAHEIQNPLNFVNNFSEVNTELIDELKDELKSGEMEEVIAIIDDIAGNEEKIKHHGKRAEAIVKGMLQHSRTTAGEKELTDINELADEFLRLAYHGLRAKDKSFNADFKLELDETFPRINVIPADIGRVLLNLINNAFYACTERSRSAISEKEKQKGKGYKPSVIVITKKMDGIVEIRVKDNGSGIPENVKQKIFQPFFTTKPTGEGTGLGLSLSYDIVTKGHGGELEVITKENEGTEFKIKLPVNL